MRIDPQRDTVPAVRPTATAGSSTGFASALASARSSVDPSLPAAADPSHAGEVPIAQRWGEYGRGATAEGYGAPPDAAQFADAPIGPDEPASPLNPSGVTTTPAFTVDGYTARGTPVPPGFYNLAYYNWYLREGGTPLEGFPKLAEGATISETYGKFGDGTTRATSFIAAPADTGDGASGAPPAGTDAGPTGDTGATPPCMNVADALAHALGVARARATASTASSERANAASTNASATTERAAEASSVPSRSQTASGSARIAASSATAAAATTVGNGGVVTTPANDVAATLRAELTTLLRDLLRA
jgi:hypothetical protein